jgi:hypothetical protein
VTVTVNKTADTSSKGGKNEQKRRETKHCKSGSKIVESIKKSQKIEITIVIIPFQKKSNRNVTLMKYPPTRNAMPLEHYARSLNVTFNKSLIYSLIKNSACQKVNAKRLVTCDIVKYAWD